MRIGLTGSGGVGKTTLAKALSESLGVPYVKEGVREYMQENNIVHLRELDEAGTKRLQEVVIGRKIEREKALPSFVADRTTLDNIAYCLRWLGRAEGYDERLEGYIERAMAHAARYYDIIVFLPWGAFPLEDDGVRSSKRWYQYEIQMVIDGLIGECVARSAKIDAIRLRSVSLNDRVEEVGRAVMRSDLIKKACGRVACLCDHACNA